MSNCLRHKTGGLIISKLFREIENLYESDKDAFKLLLREARKMNPEKEEKENTFVFWLRDSQEYALSANKITSSLNFLSALCLKAGVMSVPILKMDSEEQIKHVLDILHRNKISGNRNRWRPCTLSDTVGANV